MAKIKRYEEGGDTGFQYEGTEEDAMATAKRRMAERDAEYAARQAAAESEAPAPAARRAARPAPKRPVGPSRATPAFAEDAPRRSAMTAPAVRAIADAVRSGAGAMRGAGVGMGDLQNRGLRGLGGGTQVPAMKKGGKVKAYAKGGKIDGIAQRGKTRGKIV